MMQEIRAVHAAIQPVETLFVVDSMTGQDAVNTAKAFNEALPLTGVILTKTDGDARGGAALSIRQITGKPIKFLGVGEKTQALEAFHPERVAAASAGDVPASGRGDQRAGKGQVAQKLAKGRFDSGFRDQMAQMERWASRTQMGGCRAWVRYRGGQAQLGDKQVNAGRDHQLHDTAGAAFPRHHRGSRSVSSPPVRAPGAGRTACQAIQSDAEDDGAGQGGCNGCCAMSRQMPGLPGSYSPNDAYFV
jgi:signal recognition particle subunit SRP54